LSLRRSAAAARTERARPLPKPAARLDAFRAALPFALTRAQQTALDEIVADLGCSAPMNRLLQGDVGSGKTVVAAMAALVAAAAGCQTAVMAPTELLAEQHFASFERWLTPLDVEVVALTRTPARARAATLAPSPTVAPRRRTHAPFQESGPAACAHRRRAASLRRRAAAAAQAEGRGRRARAAPAHHDGDADPAHARNDGVCGP
jgi:ATP-dependent DNA helicase RecG